MVEGKLIYRYWIDVLIWSDMVILLFFCENEQLLYQFNNKKKVKQFTLSCKFNRKK